MILTVIGAHFKFSDLLSSSVYFFDLYEKFGLNVQVKCGILHKAAMEDKWLSDFLLL